MTKRTRADIALMLVTMGWGASFILSKQVLDELSVFNFLGIRFLIAFLIALVIFIKPMRQTSRQTLTYGLALGVALFFAFSIQTFGLSYTTVSKSAFITGLNVVMVPLFLALIHKKKPQLRVLLGSLTAVVGLGFLTMTGSSLSINLGDGLTLLSAVFFALHIVGVGSVPKGVQPIQMGILQIGVVGVLNMALSFATETPKWPQTSGIWVNIILLAVVCTAGAYIVQNVAQQYTTATRTALIYAMEPVFAAGFGFVLIGEVLGMTAAFGAVLILLGMLISEVPMNLAFLNRFRPTGPIEKVSETEV